MIDNLAQGVSAFTSNVFFVHGDRPVVVDPGANFDVVEHIRSREHGEEPEAVVLTHTHPDHVGNLEALKDAFDVEAWGFDPSVEGVDHAIEDGQGLQLGDHEYCALHTPGHKDDHCCFYASEPKILFAGDLVFQNGSFGRTDLPEGDRDSLIESIDRVLERIDPELDSLHTGHGPSVNTDPYGHVELAGRMARQG